MIKNQENQFQKSSIQISLQEIKTGHLLENLLNFKDLLMNKHKTYFKNITKVYFIIKRFY